MTQSLPSSAVSSNFSLSDFRALGVCSDGLRRVEAFGGAIENTAAGWQAYIDANPEAWRAPLFVAWKLHKRGDISCPDLIWRVARIAFREQPDRNATLRQYGETLGPGNWREARSAAYDAAAYAAAADAADAAYDAAAAAAYAAADAAYAAAYAAYADNAAAYADNAAAYAADAADNAAYAAADADAADAAYARKRVRAEIVALAVEVLTGGAK